MSLLWLVHLFSVGQVLLMRRPVPVLIMMIHFFFFWTANSFGLPTLQTFYYFSCLTIDFQSETWQTYFIYKTSAPSQKSGQTVRRGTVLIGLYFWSDMSWHVWKDNKNRRHHFWIIHTLAFWEKSESIKTQCALIRQAGWWHNQVDFCIYSMQNKMMTMFLFMEIH